MAKKKSKVGKQKQSKAKSLTKKRKQISSQYNLPFLNQKQNKRNNQDAMDRIQLSLQSSSSVGAGDGAGDGAGVGMGLCVGTAVSKTPHNSPMNNATNKKSNRLRVNKLQYMMNKKNRKTDKIQNESSNSKNIDNETRDFLNEYQSLQERTYQQEQQQLYHQQARKKKSLSLESTHTRTDTGTSAVGNNFFNFAQPTFEFNQQLTTEELIVKTTSQLHQQQFLNANENTSMNSNSALNHHKNMNIHIGNNLLQNDENQTQSSNDMFQRLVAQKREQNKMQMLYENNNKMTEDQIKEEKMKQNSFWALQDNYENDDDDDDDNEDSVGNKHNVIENSISLFNFTAPSFSLPSDNNNHGKVQQHVHLGEDDPDL